MNVRTTKTESVANRSLLAYEKLTRLMSRWMTGDEYNLLQKSEDQQNKNIDAATLYLLHTEYGFTGEQCVEFYNKFKEKYGHLGNPNDLSIMIEDIPEVDKLKNIGCDLTALNGG